ncbi:MAG: hypothetical protein GXP32_03505 [Kiritimatiellaeota bacterium]|nr:hypothetical protein [Kiritimatiellota bacterium]
MRKTTLLGCLSLCVVVLFALGFNASQYKQITKELLKAQPEKYKNKKIYFETKYLGYATTFPPYMERSGIKAGKYFYIRAQPQNFPVVANKKSFSDLILSMKKRSSVKIYGKVKKFPISPGWSRFPHYYLVVADIQVTKEPTKEDEGDSDDNKLPKWKRRALRKIRNM